MVSNQDDWDEDTPFEPEWVVAPGATIEDILEANGQTADDLSRMTGLSRSVVARLLAGETPLTPKIAALLQQAFGRPSAEFWLKREEHFREGLAAGKEWLR